MAPKVQKGQDKSKQAQKVAEDKTFGLKNKNKSSKVQKYVQQVQKQQQPKQDAASIKKDKKKEQQEQTEELNKLFSVAIKQPKVPVGVDPKSMLCEFFKRGQCTKGFKCKFSHDLDIERKQLKINIYQDQRDQSDEEEGMENWDQETLEKAVTEKHGKEKQVQKTDKVCKFFIDAVENRQYGWFWKCPNGDNCIYKHALPPGYILKSQMKQLMEDEAKEAQVDISERIEEERQKVNAVTRVTEQVFLQWRQGKSKSKLDALDKISAERRKKGQLNGREIFMEADFQAQDDDQGAAEYTFENDIENQIRRQEEQTRQRREQQAQPQNGVANTLKDEQQQGKVSSNSHQQNGVIHKQHQANHDQNNSNQNGYSSMEKQMNSPNLNDIKEENSEDEEYNSDEDEEENLEELEDIAQKIINQEIS